jgi:predicted TIM-barrel fold metal-dependent hydrolase
LWGAAALAAGAGGYRLLRGLEDSPSDTEEIPPRLRGAALDVHVHVLGVGTGGTGCWMSRAMRGSTQARFALWNLGLRLDQQDLDQTYIQYLRGRIRSAGFLKQVVLLAHDWTYTGRGERDEARTPFYTPNAYVAQLAREHPEFLFGASIHPYRPDALEALDRAAEQGAVLVKWIPNVQAIRFDDPRCRALYRRLAHHRIALLPHVGDERALFVAGQEYGDPRTLVAPLEAGVTVIAAHAGSLGERDGRSNLDWTLELLPRWPNLYADTSALTLLTRWRALLRLAERTDVHSRLVHGSDFPLPPASTVFLGRVPLSRWWSAWKRENLLRRDFEIKQGLGLPEQIFTRGYRILRSVVD